MEKTSMRKKFAQIIIASFSSGFLMWVVAGLWHNLILPSVNDKIEAHHEGLGVMLVSYIILAMLMTFFFITSKKSKNTRISEGFKIGAIIGILWVFPHGLAMAGAHNTSIVYEIKNGIWHIVEQGIGGIIIALIVGKSND